MTHCVFCDIISHKIPGFIVDENDKVISFLPKDMECFGHTLIVPKKHYENVFDISNEDLYAVSDFIRELVLKYKRYLGATGVNILNASGKDAQQSVFHLHFHIIPRFPDDKMDIRPKFEKYKGNQKDDLQKIRDKIIN